MGKIFGFDIKLFFSKKKNLVIMAVFVALLIGFVSLNLLVERSHISSELSSAQSLYDSLRRSNLVHANQLPEYMLKNSIKAEEMAKGLVEAIKSGDWREQLALQIELDRQLLRETQRGDLVGYKAYELVESIKLNSVLLERDVEPVFAEFSMQSYHFMHSAFKDVIPTMMVLIVLLFSHDALSSETDEGTARLLLTQPIDRIKIFNAKHASRVMLSLTFFALVFSTFFVLLGFIKGFGNAEYPTLFYTGEYINASDFMLGTLMMAFLLIVAFNALAMLVSVLTNHTASSLSISVIALILLYLLTYPLGLFDSVAQFNPLSYIHITEVLSGEAALRFDNNGVQYINGMITLFATMFICQISASVIFNRKDIRS